MHKENFIPAEAGLIDPIIKFLDESKAENIVTIDLRQKSALADHMIIASGLSQRHLKALAEKLKHLLHANGIASVHMEGLNYCDWVLVDSGDVIIHLFRPEVRDIYNLEKIWTAAFPAEASASAPLTQRLI